MRPLRIHATKKHFNKIIDVTGEKKRSYDEGRKEQELAAVEKKKKKITIDASSSSSSSPSKKMRKENNKNDDAATDDCNDCVDACTNNHNKKTFDFISCNEDVDDEEDNSDFLKALNSYGSMLFRKSFVDIKNLELNKKYRISSAFMTVGSRLAVELDEFNVTLPRRFVKMSQSLIEQLISKADNIAMIYKGRDQTKRKMKYPGHIIEFTRWSSVRPT